MPCMNRRSPYTKISMNLSNRHLEVLEVLSVKYQLSRTSLISRFVEKGINEYKEQRRKLNEAAT
jgi:hypothetical protein